MNKLFTRMPCYLLLSSLLFCATLPTPSEAREPLFYDNTTLYSPLNTGSMGDINNDGTINMSDVLHSFKIMAGLEGIPATTNVDINGDGRVGLAEIIYILNFLAQ